MKIIGFDIHNSEKKYINMHLTIKNAYGKARQ